MSAPDGIATGVAPAPAVVVSFFATIRDAFGDDEVSVPMERARSVRHLLDGLCTSPGREQAVHDERGALRRDLTLLVNGHHIGALGGLDTPLKSGDVVSVFPQLFGG